MQLFTEETPWEKARKDVRFTASALDAHGGHDRLAKPVRAILVEWNAIDQLRRDADDGLVDGHAVVKAVDALLDRLVIRLAARLRLDENEGGNTFGKFFPEPPSDVVRLGLESEIARTQKFHVVAGEVGASPEVRAILQQIVETEVRGTAVLSAREKAVAEVARVSLRIQTWKEKANAARQSVENQLDAHAIKQGLGRDYADEFFPTSAKSSRKKVKGEPGDK